MKNVRALFAWAILIGNLAMMVALSTYVVRAPGHMGVVLVPKSQLTLLDTFVDTRNWTAQDAQNHPAVVSRLVSAGRTDLLGAAASNLSCCDGNTDCPTTGTKAAAVKTTEVKTTTVVHPATQPAAGSSAKVETTHTIFDFGR